MLKIDAEELTKQKLIISEQSHVVLTAHANTTIRRREV